MAKTMAVEPDGSAYMEVPALRPLFFVALDGNGLSVKRMQSFVSVMPGETSGCVGCHEERTEGPPVRSKLMAMARPPSRVEPIEGVPDMIEFPRHIQPILDRHCVRCHNDKTYAGKMLLTPDRGPWYSHAYASLMSRGHVSHGRDANSNIAPRKIGSSASRLMHNVLTRHNDVDLTQREMDTIRLWIECGAPYPATYAALGTGMVRFEPDTDVLQRRCQSCHAPRDRDKRRWESGFRTHPDLLANLTRPERSLILLASLAQSSGGLGLCREKAVFVDTEDADFRKLLDSVRRAKERLDKGRRFDMDGFRPNVHYVREMRRYGILPPPLQGADEAVDVYTTDRAYWRSFWYEP